MAHHRLDAVKTKTKKQFRENLLPVKTENT